MLYPLKFTPILKERIWGGKRLLRRFGEFVPEPELPYGEAWVLSAIEGSVSVVSNGFLAGNNLQEIIEVYMGDLVGDKVYQKFGIEFPLLFKLIDTADDLSVQVHPDNEMAQRLHHAYGKSEMWYILESDPNSKIISGFNQKMSREKCHELIQNNRFQDVLMRESVKPDDVFYIPSGKIHSLGSGILLFEIQQTSDVTYRLFDWNRQDAKGGERELHTDLALDAINFEAELVTSKRVLEVKNKPQTIDENPFFTTNRLSISKQVERDFIKADCFRVYFSVKGAADIAGSGFEPVRINEGETVLVPAEVTSVLLEPLGSVKLLEILIS